MTVDLGPKHLFLHGKADRFLHDAVEALTDGVDSNDIIIRRVPIHNKNNSNNNNNNVKNNKDDLMRFKSSESKSALRSYFQYVIELDGFDNRGEASVKANGLAKSIQSNTFGEVVGDMFDLDTPVKVTSKIEKIDILNIAPIGMTGATGGGGATGSSTGTTGSTGSSTGTTGATGSNTGAATGSMTGTSTASSGATGLIIDGITGPNNDMVEEEVLSTEIIATGPTGSGTGNAGSSQTGSATGATAINMLKSEREKVLSAIKSKQSARKKLCATLSKFKALIQKRLQRAHESMSNANVDMKEAIQAEEEARNAINTAIEKLHVYNERKNFVDVIESGLVESEGSAATSNPELMSSGNTRLPHSDTYVSASLRLLPSRLHASASNLVVAVRKLDSLLKSREEVDKKLIALKEKRAVLRGQQRKYSDIHEKTSDDGEINKGSSFNDVKLYVTQLKLGQVVKTIKVEEQKMAKLEEDLVHAKEIQKCAATENHKLEIEQVKLESRRDVLSRVARKLVGEADALENKLEFHPLNKTLKIMATRMRKVAEKAVQKGREASSVASISGEIVIEHKRYQEALLAIKLAHKDQVFAQQRKNIAMNGIRNAKSNRLSVLNGLKHAEVVVRQMNHEAVTVNKLVTMDRKLKAKMEHIKILVPYKRLAIIKKRIKIHRHHADLHQVGSPYSSGGTGAATAASVAQQQLVVAQQVLQQQRMK
jgi:hypothetical protein